MKLRCHAIKQNGEMCGARATGIAKTHAPCCDRPKHFFGNADFAPITDESARPTTKQVALIVVEFLDGVSIQALARRYKMKIGHVEDILRAWL